MEANARSFASVTRPPRTHVHVRDPTRLRRLSRRRTARLEDDRTQGSCLPRHAMQGVGRCGRREPPRGPSRRRRRRCAHTGDATIRVRGRQRRRLRPRAERTVGRRARIHEDPGRLDLTPRATDEARQVHALHRHLRPELPIHHLAPQVRRRRRRGGRQHHPGAGAVQGRTRVHHGPRANRRHRRGQGVRHRG